MAVTTQQPPWIKVPGYLRVFRARTEVCYSGCLRPHLWRLSCWSLLIWERSCSNKNHCFYLMFFSPLTWLQKHPVHPLPARFILISTKPELYDQVMQKKSGQEKDFLKQWKIIFKIPWHIGKEVFSQLFCANPTKATQLVIGLKKKLVSPRCNRWTDTLCQLMQSHLLPPCRNASAACMSCTYK